MLKKIILCQLVFLIAISCDDENGSDVNTPNTPTDILQVHGTYKGTAELTGSSGSFQILITVVINQDGSTVHGTWLTDAGGSGTISGTIIGNKITNIVITQINPCHGSAEGEISILENGIVGSTKGSDCFGEFISNFNLERV